MIDSELDIGLREAAPQVSAAPGLASHRARILAEARARRGRRLRAWSASAVAAAVLVGGGSVAVAGDGRETPWGWVADNVLSIERTDGSACFQGLRVEWHGLAEDDPIVQDAKAIVSGIDLETLDTSAMEAQLREEYGMATDLDGVMLNSRRALARRSAAVQRLADELRSIPSALAGDESTLEVREAIDALAPDDAELVRLVYWDGLASHEAAAVLGINPSTARSRLARARQRLRTALEQPAEDELLSRIE